MFHTQKTEVSHGELRILLLSNYKVKHKELKSDHYISKLLRVFETILNLRINGYFLKTTGFMAINLGTAFIMTLFILTKSYNLPRDCF